MAIPGVLLRFLERASVAFGLTRTKDCVPQIPWVSEWTVDPDHSTIHCRISNKFMTGLGEALKDNGRFA